MSPFRTFTSALGGGLAIVLFAACSGGSQVPGTSSPGTGSLAVSRAPSASGYEGVLGYGGRGMPAAHAGSGWLSREASAGKMLLYVADQFNQRIAIYSQHGQNPALIGQITDAIGGPDGIFVDNKGTLYVCNFGTATVTEYPKGQTMHSKTLTGAGSPKYIVVGLDGTVYVSNFNASQN